MPPSIPAVDSGPTPPHTNSTSAPRLASLDQFRGYTVAGMFLVNYLSGFAVTPAVLGHHNTYCSYADTIMPHFLFAVGFAFRLTFGRRASTAGIASAYFRVARRFVSLALVAILFYSYLDGSGIWAGLTSDRFWATLHESAKRTWCQTLMHIAVTSLWVLPVIRASAATRIVYMIGSACSHVFLSWCFNVAWINSPPTAIDGGPLGFLTWSIPTIVGTLACDAVAGGVRFWPNLLRLAAWACGIMLLGYGLSCGTRLYDVARMGVEAITPSEMVLPPAHRLAVAESASYFAEPPFVAPPGREVRHENYWMMSQRYSTVSYQVFAAGFSLAVFLLFYLVCDRWGWQLGVWLATRNPAERPAPFAFGLGFRTLGRNALLGYILGILIQRPIKRFIREHIGNQATGLQVLIGLIILLVAVCLILRLLEWRKIYVRM